MHAIGKLSGVASFLACGALYFFGPKPMDVINNTLTTGELIITAALVAIICIGLCLGPGGDGDWDSDSGDGGD